MIQQQTITTTVFVQPCDVEILNVFVVSWTLLQQWISLKLISSMSKKQSKLGADSRVNKLYRLIHITFRP
jgi:hypothetical protein